VAPKTPSLALGGAGDSRVTAVPPAYAQLLVVVFFLFLLFSDWVVLGDPLLLVRRILVAVLAAASLPLAVRHPRSCARVLTAPPLVFFAGFLVLGLALSPTALEPTRSAFHALAFGGVLLFAWAVTEAVSLATTLALVRVALALKLLASFLLGLFGRYLAGSSILGSASASLHNRHVFGGLFGNPNPLCDAATLYLVLAAGHLIESGQSWSTARHGPLRLAWYGVTIPVAAYLMWQSLSRSSWIALAITATVFGFLAVSRVPSAVPSLRHRVALLAGSALVLLVAIPLLIIWINTSRGVIRSGGAFISRLHHAMTSGSMFDTSHRPLFWELALRDVEDRPWTGYGMVSTPRLYAPHFAGRPEHSHNLELEAALYAGVPGALLIVLFVVTSVRAAVAEFHARRPLALSVGAALIFLFVLAQVEPTILGSPYPSLLIVLVFAGHLHPSR
jgi:O-antigen ligase